MCIACIYVWRRVLGSWNWSDGTPGHWSELPCGRWQYQGMALMTLQLKGLGHSPGSTTLGQTVHVVAFLLIRKCDCGFSMSPPTCCPLSVTLQTVTISSLKQTHFLFHFLFLFGQICLSKNLILFLFLALTFFKTARSIRGSTVEFFLLSSRSLHLSQVLSCIH